MIDQQTRTDTAARKIWRRPTINRIPTAAAEAGPSASNDISNLS